MSRKLTNKLISLTALGLFLASEGMAAVLPGGAMPATVGQAITDQQSTAQPAPVAPVKAPEESVANAKLQEQAKKIKFHLNKIILKGNHVYSTAELSKIYSRYENRDISVADLFTITQEITNYYRNNGYILSRAILPPQRVQEGIVTIQVIEGYINAVDVTGKPYRTCARILVYGNKIKQCRPLYLPRMTKYLLMANDIPGTQVKAVFAPSKLETGAADLSLVGETKPITGYFSYDDYGTRYIGPQQFTGNVALNSFAMPGDSTNLTVVKTPRGEELTYGDINYSLPVNDEGMRFVIGGTRTGTHPEYVLEPVDINGINYNYYSNVSIPLIRTETQSLILRSGFTLLNSNVTAFTQELYNDHVRSLDIGTTYSFSDRFMGSNLFSGDIRQGLPIFDYTKDTNPVTALTSRPGGHANYTKLLFSATRLQALPRNFSLYGNANGQYAFEALLSSEQFTFGGSQIGRGYDSAELIGDRGLSGSFEVRYDLAVNRFPLQSLQLYTFYDAGVIWNIEVLPSSPAKVSAMSTGFGTRFYFNKYISGNVMWTQPLTKKVAAMELIGDGRAPRMFFSVTASLP